MYAKKTNFIIRLLINLTMANLNEDDAIDRFKRGSEKFIVKYKSISATKQSFIEAQIKTLNKDIQDGGRNGKLAVVLRQLFYLFCSVGYNLLVCI